jgi:hypothetical protein
VHVNVVVPPAAVVMVTSTDVMFVVATELPPLLSV